MKKYVVAVYLYWSKHVCKQSGIYEGMDMDTGRGRYETIDKKQTWYDQQRSRPSCSLVKIIEVDI